jgi:hypothetical protein
MEGLSCGFLKIAAGVLTTDERAAVAAANAACVRVPLVQSGLTKG